MIDINNYILEKLHIHKGYDVGIDNKEEFLNYFKDHGCDIYIDNDNIKCWIWLTKGKGNNVTYRTIGAKFPFTTLYLYDEWWDIRKQGDTDVKEMQFWYTRGPRAYQSMYRYQFKRDTHLLYNEENAEKIVNKLNYVYDKFVK